MTQLKVESCSRSIVFNELNSLQDYVVIISFCLGVVLIGIPNSQGGGVVMTSVEVHKVVIQAHDVHHAPLYTIYLQCLGHSLKVGQGFVAEASSLHGALMACVSSAAFKCIGMVER